MNDLNLQIIKLLINAGLTAVAAEELSEQIEAAYKEARRLEMVERGRKGGLKPTNKKKGWAALKQNDPKRYAEVQRKSNNKA